MSRVINRIDDEIILNGSMAMINQTRRLDSNKITRFCLILGSCLILSFFRETMRSMEPKTSDKLATFDPITFPITIEPLFSRETKKVVNISGAEVPNAITVDPIKKGEKPNCLAVKTEYFSSLSALTHIKAIPKHIAKAAMIIIIFYSLI